MEVKQKIRKNQNFKISRFKEKIKRTKPHKHGDYYELIYLNDGEGYHWIETEKFPVSPPEVYFMKPGQMHCWQFTGIPRGFVILFRKEYFDPVAEKSILELLQALKVTVRTSLAELDIFDEIFNEILSEFEKQEAFSDHIIHGYLRASLAKILQVSSGVENTVESENSLYTDFLSLLSIRCPELHNVRDYARLLHITPQNLNAVCKKNSVYSASEHIAHQLNLEAKRYILHTDKSINEIADLLYFNDSSYFIKFFKKREGCTPGQFRERHFK
ncbi:helix-turn-helix domain-containing protein [Membranihabitans maritimus]|uniref:helix-turn-helix domain-containing protein n=1 Tax=Membranihabitans maritimus TaxID=2904244 RepID=UPI001F33055D|nr:AraC family transcriptional regulator [Membranihabitans maritimus]